MQMPYAVVVVSVMAALTPQLAGLSTAGDLAALAERLRFGLRQALVIIVPCALVLVLLAQPLVAIAAQPRRRHDAPGRGTVLAVLAAGLPGFTVFQLCVRGLQAMQRARDVFVALRDRERRQRRAGARDRPPLAGRADRERVDRLHRGRGRWPLAALAARGVPIAAAVWSRHVRRSVDASLAAAAATAAVYAASGAERGVRAGGALRRWRWAPGWRSSSWAWPWRSRRVDRRRRMVEGCTPTRGCP